MWSDWTNVLGSVEWIKVLVVSLIPMALGMAWYSNAMFAKPWMKLVGLKEKDMNSMDGMAVPMIGTYIMNVIAVAGLAVMHGLLGISEWMDGATFGLFVGLVFVSTGWLTNYLFEKRPALLWKINAGYATLVLAVMSAALAAWK